MHVIAKGLYECGTCGTTWEGSDLRQGDGFVLCPSCGVNTLVFMEHDTNFRRWVDDPLLCVDCGRGGRLQVMFFVHMGNGEVDLSEPAHDLDCGGVWCGYCSTTVADHEAMASSDAAVLVGDVFDLLACLAPDRVPS